MPGVVIAKAEVLDAAERAASRYVELLRSVEDASGRACGRWSVGETAAHTSHTFKLFADMARGVPSPMDDLRRLSDEWEEALAADGERDPKVIAGRIEAATKEYMDAARSGPDFATRYHGGVEMPISAVTAFMLAEAVVHGFDIARATGRSWNIDPNDASLIFAGITHVAPEFVDAAEAEGLTATYEISVRGGPRVLFVFAAGSLTVEIESQRTVDCRLSVDPVAYLLVGFGRASQWKPVLTGKIVAHGRKPWLSLKLPRLFRNP